MNNVEELGLIQGSKYIQSSLDSVFLLIRNLLNKGRHVLFSGTPCQVDALYHFLGNKYTGLLYTIDLVCHGVPSSLIFQDYLKSRELHYKSVVSNISFRDKSCGWLGYSLKIEFKNKKPYLKNRRKYFSISHSNEYIALCFSDFDCGVDVERIKERDYKSIAERMHFDSNSLEEFYFDWTKYEAVYKLGCEFKSYKNFQFEDYVVTTVSANSDEEFQIYIQSEK